jgi:hypothetical protein
MCTGVRGHTGAQENCDIGELGFLVAGLLLLLLDNQSAIQVGKNPEHHRRMKHLDL